MAGGNVPANLRATFIAAGKKYNIPPDVLAGVASVETDLGKNTSTSSAGAVGFMQFEPATAATLGINPNDPVQSIFGAAELLNQYGYQSNPTRALGAYNGGPGNPQYAYAAEVQAEAKRLAPQLSGPSSAVTSSANPATTALMSGGSSPSAAGASSDLFGTTHSSELLYATVWLGALLLGVSLLGLGVNRSTHAARTAQV